MTAGTVDGLRHLLAALPAGPVGLEDPGYRAAAETIRTCGREVRDLPALEPHTDLRGLVRRVRHACPPAPARPGDVRSRPAHPAGPPEPPMPS